MALRFSLPVWSKYQSEGQLSRMLEVRVWSKYQSDGQQAVCWRFGMQETKWVRLLAYVTGLVNQRLLFCKTILSLMLYDVPSWNQSTRCTVTITRMKP